MLRFPMATHKKNIYRFIFARLYIMPVIVMVIGAFFTGYGDIYFDIYGYIVVFCANISMSIYVVSVRKAGLKLNKFGTLYYNCLVATPLLFISCVVFGDFQYVYRRRNIWKNLYFNIYFYGGTLLSFFINIATIWCLQVNTALTVSVIGSTKNVIVVGCGMIFFNDYHSNVMTNIGVCITLLGSFMYAYSSYLVNKNDTIDQTTSLLEDSDNLTKE